MNKGPFRVFILAVGYLLLVWVLPAFLQNAFEVYVGTVIAGPQMVGFTLTHANPDAWLVKVVRYSSLAYPWLTAFLIIVLIRILLRPGAGPHLKFFAWCFVVLSVHGLMVSLYGYWSPLFGSDG